MSRGAVVGLVVLLLCVVVTLAALAVGLRRGDADGAFGFAAGGRDAVALVKLDGAITDAMVTPRRGGRDNVYAQLRRAESDPNVRAVVLRINSPGGSASASQALYDQIRRLRDGGKKVVVHFADTAASGGYYVGAAGDRIVAQPTTITGSIGVIIVALDLRGLYEKIGIRERVIKSGPYKDILSTSRDLTREEEAILQKLVSDTLDQFVKVVVEGRNLPEAEVRRIADGRIFSGSEARTLKLVDELGDTRRAVQLAAELAGLPDEPRVVLYEPERGLGLLDLLGEALWSGNPVEGLLPAPGISIRYEWRG